MKVKARDVFVACDLGAMIGLSIIYFSNQVAWQIAAIYGGIAGGLIYIFWQFAPIAAAAAWKELFYIPLIWKKIMALRHISSFAKWGIATFLFLAISWAGFFLVGFYTVFDTIADYENAHLALRFWAGLWSFTAVISLIVLFAFTVATLAVIIGGDQPFFSGTERNKIKTLREIALWFNSVTALAVCSLICILFVLAIIIGTISFAFLCVFLLGMLIWNIPNICLWIARIAIEALRFLFIFLFAFGRETFTYYHKIGFILCTVDTAVGTIVSYYLFMVIGNMPTGFVVLFGGLLAGLIGALNAEVISKRLLRFVPRNS